MATQTAKGKEAKRLNLEVAIDFVVGQVGFSHMVSELFDDADAMLKAGKFDLAMLAKLAAYRMARVTSNPVNTTFNLMMP